MGEFEIKLGIIIQARMGSTRLPGKVLKPIGNNLLLGCVLQRLGCLIHQASVVVATSDLPQNNAIEDFCRSQGIPCFRGSENNVLQRYYLCSIEHGFEHIVRLTADNPFYDVESLDALIQLHLDKNADFSHSFASLPMGVGAEIFTFQALKQSHEQGREAHHLEHVDEYMLEHPELFDTHVYQAEASKCYPDMRLTVDTPEDYEKACAIVAYAKHDVISTEEAIQFCLRSA